MDTLQHLNVFLVARVPKLNTVLEVQDRPKNELWGTPLVTGLQLNLTPFTTTLCARPLSHFIIL